MEKTKASAVHYVVDSGNSRFTVKAFASGLLSAFGHSPTIAIRGLQGDVRFDPENLEEASLRIVARAETLAVADDIGDKDRREMERQMHEEVLESARYPEIVYECTRVAGSKTGDGQFSVVLNGELTLHGVTREQPIAARVYVTGNTVRANGGYSLRQSDYEMHLVKALGGVLKVKDELKFSFDIALRKDG